MGESGEKFILWMTFRLFFAILSLMLYMPSALEHKKFVVECKRCRRDIPSGAAEFPFQPVAVKCPLCGELRQYLPSEVALGNPHYLIAKRLRAGGRNRRPV